MKKYHEKQNGQCCKLITVLNARMYLTGEYVSQSSDEFEELIDLCKCRYGSAINICDVLYRYNMTMIGGPAEYAWIKDNLPCEVSTTAIRVDPDWVDKYNFSIEELEDFDGYFGGLHSVCVVGAKAGKVRVANLFKGKRKWINWEKFKKLLLLNKPNFDIGVDCVSFKLSNIPRVKLVNVKKELL